MGRNVSTSINMNVNSAYAIGDIKEGFNNTDPNWLLCDGKSYLKSAYPELSAILSPKATYNSAINTSLSYDDIGLGGINDNQNSPMSALCQLPNGNLIAGFEYDDNTYKHISVYRSTDYGRTWIYTNLQFSSLYGATILNLPGKVCIVGSSSSNGNYECHTSVNNGLSFTTASINSTNFAITNNGPVNNITVQSINDKLFAFYYYNISTSIDGINWTKVTITDQNLSPISKVYFLNNKYYSIGHSNRVITSDDGIVWSYLTLPINSNSYLYAGNNLLVLMVYANVSIYGSNTALYLIRVSRDFGITWSDIKLDLPKYYMLNGGIWFFDGVFNFYAKNQQTIDQSSMDILISTNDFITFKYSKSSSHVFDYYMGYSSTQIVNNSKIESIYSDNYGRVLNYSSPSYTYNTSTEFIVPSISESSSVYIKAK